jgi:hypothetical protein
MDGVDGLINIDGLFFLKDISTFGFFFLLFLIGGAVGFIEISSVILA